MTKERLQAVLLLYADKLEQDGHKAVQCRAEPKVGTHFHTSKDDAEDHDWRLGHAAWMCREAMVFTEENDIEKAMRWLGFIQGAFWVCGYRTIDEMRADNSPYDVERATRILKGEES